MIARLGEGGNNLNRGELCPRIFYPRALSGCSVPDEGHIRSCGGLGFSTRPDSRKNAIDRLEIQPRGYWPHNHQASLEFEPDAQRWHTERGEAPGASSLGSAFELHMRSRAKLTKDPEMPRRCHVVLALSYFDNAPPDP